MGDNWIVILGISLIFLCTTAGAFCVFFMKNKEISAKWNRIFNGFAGGVMLSSAFFSLVKPAIEMDVSYMPSWSIVAISIVLGALFLWGIDMLIPHLHANDNKEEGIEIKPLSKTSKMFLAVTIHNIPEGLSVGIAFGVALAMHDRASLIAGLLFAVGIGLQNIPEGLGVSLPIKGETGSSPRAFLFGMFSGAVEPVAAVVGLFLASQIVGIMPWALAFAAGCMIYVVAEEMIPNMSNEGHDHYGIWSFIIGFVIMMILDCLQF